jgi:hypothetical protein
VARHRSQHTGFADPSTGRAGGDAAIRCGVLGLLPGTVLAGYPYAPFGVNEMGHVMLGVLWERAIRKAAHMRPTARSD